MSFSKRSKKEILKKEPDLSQIDMELLAYLYFSGSIRIRNNSYKIVFKASENIEARYIYKIIKAKYDYSPAIEIQNKRKFSKNRFYIVLVEDSSIADLILKLSDYYEIFDLENFLKKIVLQSQKKIFLKIAFLLKGSVNDPYRGYNLELNLSDENEAKLIRELMKDFNIDAKINNRNDNYSLYIKDSDKISDFLAIIGANKSLLELENVRALKSIRNDINRQTNFDKANIDRTIKASFRQVEAIKKLKEKNIFDNLSEQMKELANLREEYLYISIEELGKMLTPPLSKAKVNYRLQKLIKLAESDDKDG